jgi:hypothetical protein
MPRRDVLERDGGEQCEYVCAMPGRDVLEPDRREQRERMHELLGDFHISAGKWDRRCMYVRCRADRGMSK